MALIETEAKNFSRDMHNMALINTNVKAYQAHKKRKEIQKEKEQKIIDLETQLQNLIKEVQEKLSKDTEEN
ncbi:MAG: hypothetical protein KC589_06995 [Nanoarchaeota archaeon]|nr:hypothetical protein [Nanoarchaeota archaeon]